MAVAASATGAVAGRLGKAIQAAAAGSPSPAAVALARGAAHPLLTPIRSVLLATAVAAAALGLGAAVNPHVPAQPPKDADQPAAREAARPGHVRGRPVPGQRPGGRRPVQPRWQADRRVRREHLYVWDATDGSLLRTIETKLGGLPDPAWPYERDRAFAMHPKKPLVALGGVRDNKTVLQVWDFEAGNLVAETVSPYRGLRVLAWTPDGRLLERTASSPDPDSPIFTTPRCPTSPGSSSGTAS